MNEEEKKAIDVFKKFIENDDLKKLEVNAKIMETVLNLIEKQQKEIEELKEYKKIAELTKISCCTAQNCEALNNSIREGLENQKLREEIEKYKWKPISEYNRKDYDWVLVKYFDGDYECVPEVAEKRSDGKWYTSEKEIPFEVKYFFDMQLLKEEE